MIDFDKITLSDGQTLESFFKGETHKPEHYSLSYSSEGIHLSQGRRELFIVDRKHADLMTKIWYLLNMANHDPR